MSLQNMDLNLLKTLDVLLEEQSVTNASVRLGLSQPATSSALGRLRVMFEDELLVLVGRKMYMTPRAETLQPQIRTLLSQIEATLTPEHFDPATSERHFTFASADYISLVLLPPLLKHLEKVAPKMRIQVIDLSKGSVSDAIQGKIDGLISPRDALPRDGLQSRTLFQERLVCIARRGHPEIDGKIDLTTFQRLLHARYQTEREVSLSSEARQLKSKRINSTPLITCPSFLALPFLVSATDAIALVQERLALQFQKPARLQIVTPPLKTDPLDLCLFWTARQNTDAPHKWLRDAMSHIARKI